MKIKMNAVSFSCGFISHLTGYSCLSVSPCVNVFSKNALEKHTGNQMQPKWRHCKAIQEAAPNSGQWHFAMYEKNEEDIRHIEEWLHSQKFLPKDLSRHIIYTFLLGCEGDRAKTKKVIGNYFYARQSIPELFTSRDPLLRENLLSWKASCFVPLKEKQDGCRVYLGAPLNSETYEYVAFVKQMFMSFDLLIKNNEWGNGDRILILSYDKLELNNLNSFTIYITGKTAECERDNYLPGKLRAVHNVHIPPFMKKIHERFQPHLRPEDQKAIFFHKSLRSLYKHVRPEILPLEFGGHAGPLRILAERWLEIIKAHRNFFVEEEEKRMREARGKVGICKDDFNNKG